MYGLNPFERVGSVINITRGTKFEISKNYVHMYENYLLNGCEPLLYKGNMMSMVYGRGVDSTSATLEQSSCSTVIKYALNLINYVNEEDSISLKKLILRNYNANSQATIIETLSIPELMKLQEILTEDIEVEEYTGSKVFYHMDRVTHHKGSYAVGLAMMSSRISNYESINGANEKGWYLADGALYVYNENDLNQFNGLFYTYSDPYKRPGTTVDTQERQAVNIRNGLEYKSDQDFVGGVTMEDEYVVAAMALESFHNDVPGSTTTEGYGGAQPIHNCSLVAQKSWFMFDDEIVALGSAINANDGYDVLTVVENRKLASDDYMETITFNDEVIGKAAAFEGSVELQKEGISWVYLEGTGGYCFPQGGNLKYRLYDNFSKFFEMWLDHGVSPADQNYAYILLPNKNREETKVYAANPNAEILYNTAALQAVRENALGITGMVFWEAGQCNLKNAGEITVNCPLLMMAKETEAELLLSISDPTQKLETATITINNQLLTLIDCDTEISIDTTNVGKKIMVDFTEASGKTITVKFKTY